MLSYVWEVPHLRDHWKAGVEAAPSIDALLATVLETLTRQRIRVGLGRDYRQHGAQVSGIRGRVDFGQSLKRLSFKHGRAFCRYQRLEVNAPKNQIIRSTLARLVQLGDFGTNREKANRLRSRLRRLVRDLDGIEIIELKSEAIRREHLKRHDRDYSVMLSICHLVSQRQMPNEARSHTGLPRPDRDSLTLHDVYEKFVVRFFASRLSGWTVRSQPKLSWPAASHTSHLPAMYPDIVLQHGHTRHLVVVDTKFTAKSLVAGQFGQLKFDRNHVFQIYAYLKSQEHQSQDHEVSTGVLLYPAARYAVSEAVVIQGHEMRWESINLAQPWEQIEQDLLELPSKWFPAWN